MKAASQAAASGSTEPRAAKLPLSELKTNSVYEGKVVST